MAESVPPFGLVDSAFEEPPRRGTTRVFHGNHEGPSRDDPSRLELLFAQVSDLITRVEQLETRLQDLEGDLGDEPDEDDDEPPV